MENQSMEIPEPLRPIAEVVTQKLREISLELQNANTRYYKIVAARIALTDLINYPTPEKIADLEQKLDEL